MLLGYNVQWSVTKATGLLKQSFNVLKQLSIAYFVGFSVPKLGIFKLKEIQGIMMRVYL